MKTYSDDFYKKAADYTAGFEGFASKAYWDVNAYRIGYGSDTITLDTSGKFRKVVQDDVTTKELATIDLARRIPEFFKSGVVNKIGSTYTDQLPETVLIALTSFAYNYGSIKKQNILDASRALDIQKIAEAVRAAQDDNKGVNKKRRNSEADFIKNAPPADKSSTSSQNTISGKVTDDKGQPIAGVQIKLTPTGSSSSPSTQGESDTPFKNSTESDEFRRWLLGKYPEYKTKPKPYNVDPPPQPNSINTKALKKAWSEKGTEYNITNLKFTSYEEMPDGVIEPITVVTDKDGNWEIKTPTTFDTNNSTVTFSKEGHEIRSLNNIQQTGGDISVSGQKEYNIPRLTLPSTPDVTTTATNKLNQEILTEETALIRQQGNSELSAQEKIANAANKQKEELKKTIIPFIIKLLSQFGGVALQAIISKIPLEQIKNQIQCPTQAKLLELINKRNKLVKQVNNAYKIVTTLTKTIRIVDTALTAIQAGITAIEALPYPSIGVPPLGLPPLTSGIIEITGSSKDKLKEALKKAKVVINIVTLALAAFGAILGIVLRLLNSLDGLIQQCSQEQDIPFETINTELNSFVNQSTGISNSAVIQATQEDDTYRGFKLEIKLDTTSSSKYPRRFAQALTKQGIPVLKTDSSFASDPQVLLDQLKFIIDSNPQLTAE